MDRELTGRPLPRAIFADVNLYALVKAAIFHRTPTDARIDA